MSADHTAISLGPCQCTGATPRMVFYRVPGERSDRYVPSSALHATSEVKGNGDADNLVVARSWAEKEGLA